MLQYTSEQHRGYITFLAYAINLSLVYN